MQRVSLLAVVIVAAAACSGGSTERSSLGARRARATATLPGGTSIAVGLTTPADGALVASPPGDVTVSGTASIGGEGGGSAGTALLVVIDVSGSTTTTCGAGSGKSIIQCQLDAALDLRQKAAAGTAVKEMGIIIMGGGAEGFLADAQAADASPSTGVQHFAAPGADAGGAAGPDLAEVIGSITATGTGGEVAQFTDFKVGTATDYAAAVQRANLVFGESSQPDKLLVFFAGGPSNFGANVNSLPSLGGVVIQAFAFGGSTCATASTFGTLQDVADLGDPGSACQAIAGAAALPDFLPTASASSLTAVSVAVDGVPVTTTVTPSLPVDGPADVTFGVALTGLVPGHHDLCATATGTDGGGTGSVTQCAAVTVANIALAPATAILELGPGAHHTVTATVAAGLAGGVPGVPVTFSVVSGPNIGAGPTAATAADGTVAFTYPARQGLAGLGLDTIRACFTDDAGTQACAEATARWQDTTAPAVSCPPGPNPGGKVPPSYGGPAQRPDGFYLLMALDAVDPAPEVFLVDGGSGHVFGPFASGVAIKYTQAPGGKPVAVPMGGPTSAVAWHIRGTGDAGLYAVDASGNRSGTVDCLVPPKPM